MKRNIAANINTQNKVINEKLRSDLKNDTEVGNKLLTNEEFTLENIKELGCRIAEQNGYNQNQLIVCNSGELNELLAPHKNDNIQDKPIFIMCDVDSNKIVVSSILKSSGQTVCLFKDFLGTEVPDFLKESTERYFGEEIEFKIHAETGKVEDRKTMDMLCLKTLQTMMVSLKSDKKNDFIEGFAKTKNFRLLDWIKNGAVSLKNELFSLVKDGYYKTVASDVDQLSKDVKFKIAIQELINSIPLLEEVDHFLNYQKVLKEFVEIEDNDVDEDPAKITLLAGIVEQAREKAFSKVKSINIKTQLNKNGLQELAIVTLFPAQMEKFTRIFEPLTKSTTDEKLEGILREISEKLGIDYKKLRSFFKAKEEGKSDSEDSDGFSIKCIEVIISELPELKRTDNAIVKNKPFDQLLSETVVEESSALNAQSLGKSCSRVGEFFETWKNRDAREIRNWAISKKGTLPSSQIYEALAVMDRANELVTGGHRLRDTQILSVLTFLEQSNKGQLSQIQTGEGKTTIVSVLAAILVLQGKTTDVITSNPVLASDGVKDKKMFYNLLGLSATTNNLDDKYRSGPRDCYKADIVYGSIGNFQFDYLKDSFLGLSTRSRRQFGSIILDEVDSMIIDNATHIAKLSEPLPGMDSLKYIYIKIWVKLYEAEKKVVEELQNERKTKAEELSRESTDDERNQKIYERFLNEQEDSVIRRIEDHIKSSNPTKISIIPSHIQEYADSSLDRWISSAINARYNYHEDEQYIIREKNGEKVVQPVDYANTGITLKNTIWQYGLHQFIQLKHNLHLTSESLTSCFISNLGYINKYGSKIFGLTGTLGSESEQTLLSSVYNVGYARIPTYKAKKFREIDGLVVDDEMFSQKIADECISMMKAGRSTLVICETIKDAKKIEETLKTEDQPIIIKTFFDEDNAHITETEIGPGEVVIATNIAGRGTDFKTTVELENNKGLHVCVAFLPCNKRVEDQAFGRTARQGNEGTARLILKKSEVQKMGVYSSNFELVKSMRDLREKYRIEEIEKIKIPELKFQDELFEMFSTLYVKLKEDDVSKGENKYVLDDLKEFWAFWLEKKNFKGSELAGKNASTEFDHFKSEASKTIEGTITFNPFYSIQQAEYFISSNGKLDEAETSLNHAISMSKNPDILHSAYLKHFEIAIERGHVFIDKARKAVGDVFFISAVESDRLYKENAKKYLKLARDAFKKELDYIESVFEDEEFRNILTSEVTSEDKPDEEAKAENLFIKHIVSKQQILNLNIQHVDSLVQEIDEHKAGISIGARIPDYFLNLKPKSEVEKNLKATITDSELNELAAVGTNTTYALRQVHDVCPEIKKAAQTQIWGGISLYAAGICFPPALPVASAIGGTMITEGLTDIAIELINSNSDGKFDRKAYVKGKVISYGISLLTMGINAALQCPKILEKAKNACRWIADNLRKCKRFEKVCKNLATYFDKLANMFEKMETLAKFSKLSNADKIKYVDDLKKTKNENLLRHLGENVKHVEELKNLDKMGKLTEVTHLQNCFSALQQTAFCSLKAVAVTVVMSSVVTPAVSSSMSSLKPMIREHVSASVRKTIDREKLKTTSPEEIQGAIKEIRGSVDFETVKIIFKDAILGMSKYCNNWKLQLTALALDQLVCWKDVYNYAKDLCEKLNSKLQTTGKSTGQDIEATINLLIDQLSEELYSQFVSATIKTCRDVYSVSKSAYQNYTRDKHEEELCREANRNFEQGGPAGQAQARALSDVEKRPIHIYDENGHKTVIGGHYPGDPIEVSYFPADANNPTGHYVPYGEKSDWTPPGNGGGDNDCFFHAVGPQLKKDPDTLRNSTVQQMQSSPKDYMAPHLRETMSEAELNDLNMSGGAKRFKVKDDSKRYTDTMEMSVKDAVTKHYADGMNDFSELLVTTAKLQSDNPEAKIEVKSAANVQIGQGTRSEGMPTNLDDIVKNDLKVNECGATDAAHTIGFSIDIELPEKYRSATSDFEKGRILHITSRTNIIPNSINNNAVFDKGRDKIGQDVYQEFVQNGAKISDISRYEEIYKTRLTNHFQTSNSGSIIDGLRNAASKGVQEAWDKNNKGI